jgi:signal-transduction protein with cAMP-binding, CBS, and nucleotidyltransferase domain
LTVVQTDSVAAALHQTVIFGELHDSALRELAQVCLQRNYRSRQYLWYQGDPGDYLVVMCTGWSRSLSPPLMGTKCFS